MYLWTLASFLGLPCFFFSSLVCVQYNTSMYYTERKPKNKKKKKGIPRNRGRVYFLCLLYANLSFDILGVMHVTLACFFSLELFSLIIVKDMWSWSWRWCTLTALQKSQPLYSCWSGAFVWSSYVDVALFPGLPFFLLFFGLRLCVQYNTWKYYTEHKPKNKKTG